MPDICFENVYKGYGAQIVLDNFSLRIAAGEAVAFLGASGVGKTTVLRLLLGLEQPDGGSITGVQKLRFSCVFQEDRLCETLSGVENIALVLPRDAYGAIPEALAAVGLLYEDIHKPTAQLSGGQRRRVALVRAMEAQSDVLVLDEAFKGLDDATRQKAYWYVEKMRRGRTMLVVTHDRQDAALCTREFVLHTV